MTDPTFKYELFFELSPDLLCIAGYDGYFKKINSSFSNLLGYSLEELYAKPFNDFVHPDDRAITSKVREELTKLKPLSNFENRYVTKQGETVWLSWTSLAIDNDRLIFAIAKDITYKKRQEAERNALLANLTEANKDLRQLTYTASHDLRSPVNNLLAVFSMIDSSKISDQQTLELISILKRASEKLKQTVNNHLNILTETHTAHAKLEEVDLQESLDGVVQSIGSLLETSKTTIHANFAQSGKVKFNKFYMESVFLNLITNSIKYARPDLHPVITMHSEKVNGVHQLTFSDNGQGFDMEKVKDKIFGLQQNFHNHADSKGIGLYLVFGHVTSLGGKINVESKINEGTTFTISFPV
ncbi:MAG TPA: PAS domain-containing sensor histidine kinase [Bacteroidia bacterium]|nr:PAS domain-containing sensor histidine kinase [Bacteroidia bacterium]